MALSIVAVSIGAMLSAFTAASARAATDCRLLATIQAGAPPRINVTMLVPAEALHVTLRFSEPVRPFEETYGIATIAGHSDQGRSYAIDLEPFPGSDVEWKLQFLVDHPTGSAIVVDAKVRDTSCAASATIAAADLPGTDAMPIDPAPTNPFLLALAALSGGLLWLIRTERRRLVRGSRDPLSGSR